jgi:hypothetical protein
MMSSRVRDGYSANRSSTVSPFASIRTIWWTGIRVPFTQAWPWQIAGSIEIRSNGTLGNLVISLLKSPIVLPVENWCCSQVPSLVPTLLRRQVADFRQCSTCSHCSWSIGIETFGTALYIVPAVEPGTLETANISNVFARRKPGTDREQYWEQLVTPPFDSAIRGVSLAALDIAPSPKLSDTARRGSCRFASTAHVASANTSQALR